MEIIQDRATTPQINKSHENYALPLSFMTMLFFLWGFITVLNDILIPHLKTLFALNYTQVMLIQFCFFGAYFLVSIPAGKFVQSVGYKNGIIGGLVLAAIGCCLFYPAAEFHRYSFFLVALFVLASGITILQVSANPYVAALGAEKNASSRLNLAQGLNSLGATLAPVAGGIIFFTALNQLTPEAEQIGSVQFAYLSIAASLLVVAVIFALIKLPTLSIENSTSRDKPNQHKIIRAKHLVGGVVAIFFYVGAEVSIGSFIVNYFAEPSLGGLAERKASELLSYYWGGAMIGRFIGAYITRYVAANKAVLFNVCCIILLLITTMLSQGTLAIVAVLAIGLFNSILFPTIFTMAIASLKELTSRGSGLLCLAIVGGAIIPVLQGIVADLTDVQSSFVVPMIAYSSLVFYAWKQPTWLKNWKKLNNPGTEDINNEK